MATSQETTARWLLDNYFQHKSPGSSVSTPVVERLTNGIVGDRSYGSGGSHGEAIGVIGEVLAKELFQQLVPGYTFSVSPKEDDIAGGFDIAVRGSRREVLGGIDFTASRQNYQDKQTKGGLVRMKGETPVVVLFLSELLPAKFANKLKGGDSNEVQYVTDVLSKGGVLAEIVVRIDFLEAHTNIGDTAEFFRIKEFLTALKHAAQKRLATI